MNFRKAPRNTTINIGAPLKTRARARAFHKPDLNTNFTDVLSLLVER